MNALKIIGILLIVFGLVDLIGSFAGFDLWGTIGIHLPDLLWKYSSYIEMIAGYGLMQLGSSGDSVAEE